MPIRSPCRNGSPSTGSGIGLRSIRKTQPVEIASRTAIAAIGRGEVEDRHRDPADHRAEDRSGQAEAAAQRDPAGRLVARDDLGLEGDERRALEAARHAGQEDQDEDEPEPQEVGRGEGRQGRCAQRQSGAREQDDRPTVPPVRHVPAEQHECEGRDGLDEAEPAERQGVMGDLIRLERDDGRERADGQRVRQPGAEERPEVSLLEQGLRWAQRGSRRGAAAPTGG